jgi:tRNA 2-selenouridine synthase
VITYLDITDFLQKALHLPVLDVRSPAEYAAGHIPGAFSFPLFSDEERKEVGTTYKQISKQDAILIGLDLFGPKMSGFVRTACELAPAKEVLLHCWRGGMRSGSVAWLLDLAGFEVKLLRAGYKDYRKFALDQFQHTYPLIMIGGMTGSGKTDLLRHLQASGEQMVNLEELASHKGSAFGSIGMSAQPSIEQFENDLALVLARLDRQRRIWLEDENITIGRICLPRSFYQQMQQSTLIQLEIPRQERLGKLTAEYCQVDPALLVEAILRIQKRLGGLATKEALQAIEAGDMEKMVDIALHYYDKAYQFELHKKPFERIIPLALPGVDPVENTRRIIELAEDLKVSQR